MKRIKIILLLVLLLNSFVLSSYALPIETASQEIGSTVEQSIDGDVSTLSIANPTKSYLVVGTKAYGAPNPSTGAVLETVPANTNIWVVEKVYCNSSSCYYYYAGYTYNGESHRGYFSEYNVYKDGSRLLPASVTAQSNPAQSKQHTSLAGTVYDGPATTYSITGSVGQESIKLIRTEGNYNFIEYTVTATGKLKRGYLHYSKITGSWASLSAKNANLDDLSFFIRNNSTKKFMDVKSWATANGTIIHQWDYHGDTNQVFKLNYNSSDCTFTIQPLITNKYLTVSTNSDGSHPDRQICINTGSTATTQKFWIVKYSGVTDGYRILPVSSYGTMCLTDRTNSTDTYVKQYYTDTSNSGRDVWIIRPYHIITDNNECSAYDRSASVEYQSKYYETYNDNYNSYDGDGGDCTNYVSQCLYEAGLPEIGNELSDRTDYKVWYYGLLGLVASHSWINANLFSMHWAKVSDGEGALEGKMRCYQMIEFTNEKTAQNYINTLKSFVQEGDIIQQKTLNGTRYLSNHSMMVYKKSNATVQLTNHSSSPALKDIAEYLKPTESDENRRPVVLVIKP